MNGFAPLVITIRAVLRTLGALPGFIGAATSTYHFGATLCETKTIAQACVSMESPDTQYHSDNGAAEDVPLG